MGGLPGWWPSDLLVADAGHGRAARLYSRTRSSKAPDPERIAAGLAGELLLIGGRAGGRRAWRIVEEPDGGHEEQAAGDRGGEVEDPVVVTGRAADEHVAQHLLEHLRVARVADEVGAELGVADPAERHVVAEDLTLLPVVVEDRIQRHVRVRRLDVVGHLDVVELR